MSPLRKCLSHPAAYLVILGVAAALVWADSSREPGRQVTPRLYVAAVHSYQSWAQPALDRYVRCRYRPTCSRYSIQAVEKYGLRRGLMLTAARLWRCRGTVALATDDPVP
jgi:hypothetical protein